MNTLFACHISEKIKIRSDGVQGVEPKTFATKCIVTSHVKALPKRPLGYGCHGGKMCNAFGRGATELSIAPLRHALLKELDQCNSFTENYEFVTFMFQFCPFFSNLCWLLDQIILYQQKKNTCHILGEQ
jgi:hypothetical protein